MLNSLSKDKWKEIGTQRRAGILVPLFSVYSKNSAGIGDFQDLKLLIKWANQTGNSIVQLLPMNEVGGLFCPYDSLSSFALEPMYLALKDNNLKKLFPAGKPYVDYGIKNAKLRLLREVYQQEDKDNKELVNFKEENNYWLLDFAFFKALKEYHQGRPWYEWDEKYKNRNPRDLEAFCKEHTQEIEFQMWLQWLAFKQFKEVNAYAKDKGVLLKGDLPILVSRDSADAWAHPEFFKLEFASGAPPDMYCAKGQRWGMPTYNWEKIAADGYRYLKEKLHYAENFYDILRIDHVVGLFRIWSIPYQEPLENQGLNGFFDPPDESKWEEHGRSILSVILNNTKMLICAEDLGVIPKACPKTLEEFGIPGNDVQRWVKDWKEKHDFLAPQDYRFLSVAMLSTHDTTNWPAWWENEAGTVDEGLFIRKCAQRGIDYASIKDKLFDATRSRHGRLRWQKGLSPQGQAPRRYPPHHIGVVGTPPSAAGSAGAPPPAGTVPKEQLSDFIDLYENTYQEKEKLWKQLNLSGAMQEKCSRKLIAAVLKLTLESQAIFSIHSIIDWLYLTDIFKGDPYQYRINTPGTISDKNWSLVIPISLDDLPKHRVSQKIKTMVTSVNRVHRVGGHRWSR